MVALLGSATCAGEQVKLAWDENTEPDLRGYRVHYGTSPADFSNTIDVGLATEGVVDGLQPGTDYYFTVTAYNEAGLESEPSEPISYRTASIFSPLSYNGLIGDGAGDPAGVFTAKLNANGRASGRVFFGGKASTWRGVFDRNGRLTVEIVTRAKKHLVTLTLQLAADGASIFGTAATDQGTTDLLAHSAPLPSVSPHAGRYTIALVTGESAAGGGYGFGTINVSKRGLARFAGRLPGGAPFAAGVSLDSAATVPLFIFQPSRLTVIGRIHFRDIPEASDADGVLAVHRVSADEENIVLQAARFLPAGTAPAPSSSAAAVPPLAVEVSGVGENQITAELIPGRPMVARAASGEVITMRASSRSGLFSGACVTAANGRFTFAGALYQKGASRGFGRVHAPQGSVVLH